jgi:hypothetical protein
MTRLVRGADGRVWTLRGEMEWSKPATADDFEHDVSAGLTPGIVMLVLVVTLAVVLVAWTPGEVIVPFWVILALLAILLFFPVRWALRRPWTVVAEAPEDEDQPAEHWAGTVRGVLNVRSEFAKLKKNIENEALPSLEGPLQPVE